MNWKAEFEPTVVRRGASLGANATILCGNEIGAYAMIGAGAVVTRDVPAHALVVGNPARQIGWVSRSGDRLAPDLVCPRTGSITGWTRREPCIQLQTVNGGVVGKRRENLLKFRGTRIGGA